MLLYGLAYDLWRAKRSRSKSLRNLEVEENVIICSEAPFQHFLNISSKSLRNITSYFVCTKDRCRPSHCLTGGDKNNLTACVNSVVLLTSAYLKQSHLLP